MFTGAIFSSMSSATVNGKQTICQCYSQQATRIETDFAFCMSVVERGYFDPAIPDRGSPDSGGVVQANPSVQSVVSPAFSHSPPDGGVSASPSGGVVTVVGYEKGRFLW